MVATSLQDWLQKIEISSVLYIGNLNAKTSEEEVYNYFSQCGSVLRIILGLNRLNKDTCSFAFVQYSTHVEASIAKSVLDGTILNGQIIRCDWDSGTGIMTNRRFGRAANGQQIRDYKRKRTYDNAQRR